jgi:hypothetical protein
VTWRAVAFAVTLAACGHGLSRARPPAGGAGSPSADPGVAPDAPARPSDPAIYADPEGRFTVRFGAPPSVEVKREPLGVGEIVTTTASLSSDARLLMAMKLVMTEVARYDCAKGLAGMRDHTLAKMGCAPTSEKAVELRGRPGREVAFACTKRPMKGAMTIVCDDAALMTRQEVHAYEIIVAYAESSFDEAEARAFLASFDLR